MAQVTTEKQREAFRKELAVAEDWLYEDGAAQSGPVFRCAAVTHPHACHPADTDPVWKKRGTCRLPPAEP